MNAGKFTGEALGLVKNENFLNKTADIMGMLFPYAGLTKKAVDMYISEIEKSNMSIDTKMYLVMNAKKSLKGIKNQKQIADIAVENAKVGTDFTETSGVQDEWLERFMDSARFVSSEEMQLIWGKILANEFENAGTTPPNMIRVLSEITPNLAQVFRKLCSMRVTIIPLNDEHEIIGEAIVKVMVPYRKNENVFNEMGISFNVLSELDTLGVIKVETIGGYVTKGIEEDNLLVYTDGEVDIISKHEKNEMPIGNVMFTAVGSALSKITEYEKIDNYWGMVKKYMEANRVKFLGEPIYQVVNEGEKVRVTKISSQ